MPFTFKKLPIEDVILIESKKFEDSRGFFAELYCGDSFAKAGIIKPVKQINFSKSEKGVIRGLHYQLNPFAQGKIIRVVSGTVFDVVLDLRRRSATFGKWIGILLEAQKINMVYIPEGFAHGFEVLSDSAEFEYFCTQVYSFPHERGIRYDDKYLKILWHTKNPSVSKKDMSYPSFSEAEYDF
jgi:dTDP-4-dehydrorhamnose 3,5-epimerase